MSEAEIPLLGGDVTEGIVRVGDTVRRPAGDHSALVRHVLDHLAAAKFDGAPRFLGRDDRDRDVLTYVDGEVAGRPWPTWVADPARGVSVARLLRRLDDAMITLGLPDGAAPSDTIDGTPEPWFLGHRDVTPENTVFRDEKAYALIDFDLLRPSTRIDEIGNLLLWWGAWMPRADRALVMRDVDAAERGRLLVDAYGLAADERRWIVPVAIASAGRTWHSMRDRARESGGGWARMWDAGVGDQILRREQWLRDNAAELTAATSAT